jgi:APA family basic amino acid/polyamine antiporter
MNGMILTGPRVYYTIAIDGIFSLSFRRVSERYRTPTVALVIQGAWAAALAFTSSYEQLFTNCRFHRVDFLWTSGCGSLGA